MWMTLSQELANFLLAGFRAGLPIARAISDEGSDYALYLVDLSGHKDTFMALRWGDIRSSIAVGERDIIEGLVQDEIETWEDQGSPEEERCNAYHLLTSFTRAQGGGVAGK